MLGFFTCLMFAAAFKFGGWWWLFAILTGMAWSNGREKKKEISDADQGTTSADSKHSSSNDTAGVIGRLESGMTGRSTERVARIAEICERYAGTDFFISERIPASKLVNARQFYPLPGDREVIALLDATLFGSAKSGLAIGADGISWRNHVTVGSTVSKLRWSEIRGSSIIRKEVNDIQIGVDNNFNMSGCSFDRESAVMLLRELVEAMSGDEEPSSGSSRVPDQSVAEPEVIDVNLASFDQLISLPGIGVAEAKMILGRRESGSFGSMDELADFLALKPHKMQQLKSRIFFSGSLPRTPPGDETVSAEPAPVADSTAGPTAAPQTQLSPVPTGRVID